ncbi:MAG: hypothetical protein RIR62_275 [Pseudomonadota bacterium]|jgi:hypothetical protein
MARLSCTTCRLVRRLVLACATGALAAFSATGGLPAGPLDRAGWLVAMILAATLVAMNLLDWARQMGAALRRRRQVGRTTETA